MFSCAAYSVKGPGLLMIRTSYSAKELPAILCTSILHIPLTDAVACRNRETRYTSVSQQSAVDSHFLLIFEAITTTYRCSVSFELLVRVKEKYS